jgi:beta-alanine--pyruvate transaminase
MQYTTNTLEAHWMPFTANREFKTEPRLVVKGEGLYLWNHHGNKIIDGSSGLFNVAAGHARKEIADAVARQIMELDYIPHFQFAAPISFELASRIAELTPEGLDHVFFTNSGSEAVDTSLKISLAYHRARFEAQRVRFVGRERAYHGMNFGGLSVGGLVKNREVFGVGLPGVVHLRHTWLPEQRFSRGQPSVGAELADDLQRFVDTYGADSIACCIVEPIAGSTGTLVPPVGYLERLRELCTKHGILLIFDEVITGFGRCGAAFGSHAFGVTPDIITVAKAMTNGNLPMGAVIVRDEVYETITGAAPEGAIELFHGYTYSATTTACAAALATLDIFKREELFARAAKMSPYFLDMLFSLKDIPLVTDVRGYGMLGGVDVAASADGPGKRGYQVMKDLFAAGMLIKATGDAILVAPPLVAEEKHIDEMGEILGKVLRAQ